MKNNLQFLQTKYESILAHQESSDDINYYTGAMLLLSGLLIVTLLGIFIKDNYSMRLLFFIAVLLASLLFYKTKLKQNLQTELKTKAEEDNNHEAILKGNLRLLSSDLAARASRVSAVRWFYTINFPIFLYSIKEFISGPMSSKFLLWSLVSSFLIGIMVWNWFFKGDTEKLELYQSEVDRMIRELA